MTDDSKLGVLVKFCFGASVWEDADPNIAPKGFYSECDRVYTNGNGPAKPERLYSFPGRLIVVVSRKIAQKMSSRCDRQASRCRMSCWTLIISLLYVMICHATHKPTGMIRTKRFLQNRYV